MRVNGMQSEWWFSSTLHMPEPQLVQSDIKTICNSSPSTHDSATVNQTRYIVYASNSTVFVYLCSFELVTTIMCDSEVTAVAIQQDKGTIVVACESAVSLYMLDSNVWVKSSQEISVECPVSIAKWSTKNHLLLGGTNISIWEQQPESTELVKKWNLKLAQALYLAEFSPDAKFFATISENDRFLKLWYPTLKQGM